MQRQTHRDRMENRETKTGMETATGVRNIHRETWDRNQDKVIQREEWDRD